MKGCCSRPTLAIIIGTLHTIVNLAAAIYITVALVKLGDLNMEPSDEIKARTAMSVGLGFCLITIVFSVTMIVGVVMKRYMLIAPYLWLCIFGTVGYAAMCVIGIFALIWYGAPFAAILMVIIRIGLVVGLQILILMPIYSLHKQWRAEALGIILPTQKVYANTTIVPYQNVYATEKKPIDL